MLVFSIRHSVTIAATSEILVLIDIPRILQFMSSFTLRTEHNMDADVCANIIFFFIVNTKKYFWFAIFEGLACLGMILAHKVTSDHSRRYIQRLLLCQPNFGCPNY